MLDTKRPLILSFETSTRSGGVAVLRGDKLLAEKASGEKSSHSAQLLADVREILLNSDLVLNQINLLAVAVGPGSFTGLRIGLSTVKALASALKIPVVGISTLDAAAACSEKDGEICVVLPAGRSEYFVQSFKMILPEELKRISDIDIYNSQKLNQKAAENAVLNWISTGEIISSLSAATKNANRNYQNIPENLAVSVGRIAHKIFLRGDFKDYPPRPIYVRGAEIGSSKNAK